MSTLNDTTQESFQHAWNDLRERLDSGYAHLTEMSKSCTDIEQTHRLIDKASGVFFAIDQWKILALGDYATTGDYAAMWRTFTDTVEARLNSDGYQPGFYQGVHLALTYQRGYSRNIDAPVIINPHNR